MARYVNDGKLRVWKHFIYQALHEPREENMVLEDTFIEREDTELTLVSDASVHVGRRQVLWSWQKTNREKESCMDG